MINLIEKVLEEQIRPYLKSHYGDVKLVRFNDGILEIKLVGQCSGCPSARFTVEEVIEGRLKEKLPKIKKVVLVNEMSEELIVMAKSILKRNK